MKKIFFLLLLILFANINAQYRERINILLFDGSDYEQLPKEYKPLSDEIRKIGDLIYYQNLQHSGGNYGMYTSLTLIFNEDFEYNFFNLGFRFNTIPNDNLFGNKVSLISTNIRSTWKGRYVVDFEDYNPLDNIKNFFYLKYFLNITDEQLLANFINNINIPYNSDKSRLDVFINDIEKGNNIKIDKSIIDKSDQKLKDLCKQINLQMSKSDCGFSAYKTYIADKDDKITRKKIDDFYRNFSNQSLSQVTDDFILPRAEIDFYDKELKLTLPNEFFYEKKKNDQSNVSFYVENINHQLTYDFDEKTYVLNVKVHPFNNSLSSEFKFLSEYYDILKSRKIKSEINVDRNAFKYLEFLIYPTKVKIKVYFNDKNSPFVSDSFTKSFQLKKEFQITEIKK